jgi:hypothetical protein
MLRMDDLAIAFAERLDRGGFTYEHGVEIADKLADEIVGVAEDRTYATREDPDEYAEGR